MNYYVPRDGPIIDVFFIQLTRDLTGHKHYTRLNIMVRIFIHNF